MVQVWVQSLFLFALVWSVGANTDEEGRTTFDHTLRKLLISDPPADLKPYIKVSTTHFIVRPQRVFMTCKGCSVHWHDLTFTHCRHDRGWEIASARHVRV